MDYVEEKFSSGFEFKNPNALIELKIRPFNTSDNDYFRDENSNLGLVEAHIENCYVAVNTDNLPCYRQWLMGPSQNEKIKDFFKGSFPVLKNNEALLEAAFTLPTFRGKRIMPAAMARISEKGVDIGAKYIITFVDINNIPSLKGCKRSGFNPYVLRIEKWFLFKTSIIINWNHFPYSKYFHKYLCNNFSESRRNKGLFGNKFNLLYKFPY